MPDAQALRRQIGVLAVLAGIFVLGEVAAKAVEFYTDWLWFGSLGYDSVFVTVLMAKLFSFLAGMLVFLLPALGSLFLAKTIVSRHQTVSIREERGVAYIVQLGQDVPRRIVILLAGLIAVVLSVMMGLSTASQWETFLRFLNASPFGTTDPLFGQDIGFYFFSLPFFRYIQGYVFWGLVAILVLTVAVYVISISEENVTLDSGVFAAHRAAKLHVMVLAALGALVMAGSYRIQVFDLVFSNRGSLFGAGYTDSNARLVGLWVMLAIMAVTAILFLVSAFRPGFTLPLWGVGVWMVAAVVLGGVYPALVQKFQVEPSELDKERPYIERSIKMTRQAFELDRIQEQDYRAEDAVTADEINANPDTISNVRLWDHGPLKDTYNQIQSIRLYYDFNDVDIDRYTIGGQYRQVMLSARELSPEKLASQAQTWVTRRLQFTHGYGIAMSPVNEIVGEGLPNLLVKDLPPQGEIKIDKPQIYYGEKSSSYVIVKTTAQEFDYAKGDENVYGEYQGEGGVKLDSFFRKAMYALMFRDWNIMFTGYLTPDSRVLYNRSIQDRVRRISPFLTLDQDPYLVVADGQLVWVQDAYTTSHDYPYSSPYRETTTVSAPAPQTGQQTTQQVRTGREYNYIRNSVKVVINAYDGSTTYYVADPKDPMLATYQAIFPGLFTPLAEMPASIKAHLRYPEGLFGAQAEMYRTFHMQDPQVFYNREDLWSIPMDAAGNIRKPLDPYYLIMKLPGEAKEEFLQLLPLSPSNKDNMIAWLAARSDGDSYGKLIVYKYPKDKLIYGPSQVDARVNQDPTISAQFTLWGQAGSKVSKGNLLVIPVGRANLYVMPVYLQSDRGSIPELKRVIVSTGNKVVMEPSLGEALSKLYDGKVTLAPSTMPIPAGAATGASQPAAGASSGATTTQPGAPVSSKQVSDLVKSAQDHYNRSQDRLKNGDWAGFGDELKKLQDDLNTLDKMVKP